MASAQQQHPGMTQQTVNYGPEAAQHQELTPKPKDQLPCGPGQDRPKTIGDALEEAGHKGHDKPLELKDARAIQSAEARATGAPAGVLGGPAAYAANIMGAPQGNPTLGDALTDVKEYLPIDKVVTPRDAARVIQAESRNDPMGRIDPQGVAAAVQAAAKYNVEKGFVPQDSVDQGGAPRGTAGRGQPLSSGSQ